MNERQLEDAIDLNIKEVDAAQAYYMDLMRGGSYDLAKVQRRTINTILNRGDSLMSKLFQIKEDK